MGRRCWHYGAFKKKYPDLATAQVKIDEVKAKTCLRLYAYFCPKCKSIHLSKHAAPKNWRWR